MDKNEENRLVELILDGAVFIYPTDTVYGIGCNALDKEAVAGIKKIKGRDANKPLSIIAPSKEWIFENLITKKEVIDKYLPGKYTLILRKKDKNFLDYFATGYTLGVRIPEHWFSALVSRAGVPFITTSANLSGEKAAAELSDIPKNILEKVSIIINGGRLQGTPSTIILENGTALNRQA